MEITCNRCHQTVRAENCFCPACGLPQLVYSADAANGPAPAEEEMAADVGRHEIQPLFDGAGLERI